MGHGATPVGSSAAAARASLGKTSRPIRLSASLKRSTSSNRSPDDGGRGGLNPNDALMARARYFSAVASTHVGPRPLSKYLIWRPWRRAIPLRGPFVLAGAVEDGPSFAARQAAARNAVPRLAWARAGAHRGPTAAWRRLARARGSQGVLLCLAVAVMDSIVLASASCTLHCRQRPPEAAPLPVARRATSFCQIPRRASPRSRAPC